MQHSRMVEQCTRDVWGHTSVRSKYTTQNVPHCSVFHCMHIGIGGVWDQWCKTIGVRPLAWDQWCQNKCNTWELSSHQSRMHCSLDWGQIANTKTRLALYLCIGPYCRDRYIWQRFILREYTLNSKCSLVNGNWKYNIYKWSAMLYIEFNWV